MGDAGLGSMAPKNLRLGTLTVWAAFSASVVGFAEQGHAYIDHPWCTGGGGWSGALTCSFDSYEQCKANARTCVANPAMTPYPQHPHLEPRYANAGARY
jgi:Protein of unknown function (DUF3551)